MVNALDVLVSFIRYSRISSLALFAIGTATAIEDAASAYFRSELLLMGANNEVYRTEHTENDCMLEPYPVNGLRGKEKGRSIGVQR